MALQKEQLIDEALKMPPQDRAVIAEELISSLDTETDHDVEVAWQQEIQKRLASLDQNRVVLVPWEEVRQKLRKISSVTD